MVNEIMTVFWNGVKKGVQEDLQNSKAGFMRIGPIFRDCWQAILASLAGAAIAAIAQAVLPTYSLLFVIVTVVVTTLILAFTSGLFSIKRCK